MTATTPTPAHVALVASLQVAMRRVELIDKTAFPSFSDIASAEAQIDKAISDLYDALAQPALAAPVASINRTRVHAFAAAHGASYNETRAMLDEAFGMQPTPAASPEVRIRTSESQVMQPVEAPQVPDGVWEALQRMIEDAATRGQGSREDALSVANYRDRVKFLTVRASAKPAEASPERNDDAKTWATYIAGVIETYLNFDRPKEGREAAIAGIIERRMWCGPFGAPEVGVEVAAPVAPTQQNQPILLEPDYKRLDELSGNSDYVQLGAALEWAQSYGDACWLAALSAARPEPAVSLKANFLGNLLAVIHGDGGHYVAAHGLDKAVNDAMALFYGFRAARPEPTDADMDAMWQVEYDACIDHVMSSKASEPYSTWNHFGRKLLAKYAAPRMAPEPLSDAQIDAATMVWFGTTDPHQAPAWRVHMRAAIAAAQAGGEA